MQFRIMISELACTSAPNTQIPNFWYLESIPPDNAPKEFSIPSTLVHCPTEESSDKMAYSTQARACITEF